MSEYIERYDYNDRIRQVLRSMIPQTSMKKYWLYINPEHKSLVCNICDYQIMSERELDQFPSKQYDQAINNHILVHINKNLINFI